MSDLNSLRIFAKVVEVNGFSEAARRLQMPVSTVSRRIAELEEQLGVRLLERSTRSLRLTEVGAEVLEHAQYSAELSDAVDTIASHHQSQVSGVLRLSAPPSLCDSLLAPLAGAFQTAYPEVRLQIFITERVMEPIAEGVDLIFQVGEKLKDSALVVRRLLRYRHQPVASPAYLEKHRVPRSPVELKDHRLLAFSFWTPESRWSFAHQDGRLREALEFRPYLAVNDYAGLIPALLDGVGIGELPPLVRPELLRDGSLVEVMPEWRFRSFELSLLHHGNRYIPRPARVFKEFAIERVPAMFPNLPA